MKRLLFSIFSAANLSIIAMAITSKALVWDTSTNINTDFCEHRYRESSPHYQQFFNHMVSAAHTIKQPLLGLDLVSNIIVLKSEFIQCHPPVLNIVIETHYDTVELRHTIKAFAIALKDLVRIQIRVLIKLQDVTRPFAIWQANKGFYLYRKHQASLSAPQITGARVTPQEWEIITELASERQIEIKSVRNEKNCVFLHIGGFGETSNLQHFQRDVEQKLKRKSRVILH